MEGEIGVCRSRSAFASASSARWRRPARVLPQRAAEGDPEGAGRGEDGRDEMADSRSASRKTKFSKEARDKARAELKKLRTMSPMSAEATVGAQLSRLAAVGSWAKPTKIKRDMQPGRERCSTPTITGSRRSRSASSSISRCSSAEEDQGPDPVPRRARRADGKTSLGKSEAPRHRPQLRALCRLGGRARRGREIRGHPRPLYRAPMPARCCRGMKKASPVEPAVPAGTRSTSSGPDWRGDPSSALAECLDPEAELEPFNDH
jgi:ATP-dependent Lon protease